MGLPWWFSVKHESASGFLFGGFYLRWFCVISHDSFLFFYYVCLFSHTFLSFLFQPHSFFFLLHSVKEKRTSFFFVTTLWQLYQCVCAFLNLFSCFCSVEDHLFFSVVVVFSPLFFLISFSIITCNILHSFLFSNCFVIVVFITRLTSLCLCSVTHIKLKVLLFTLTLTLLKLSLLFFYLLCFSELFFV